MGMSTHVCGFRPADEKWRKMKAAWDACIAVGQPPPTEVSRFFAHEDPDERGITISEAQLGDAVRPWSDDCREGFEVEIEKLPPNVTHIRFYNSY